MANRVPVIVILGGGFAGLKTALLLERKLRPAEGEVVLVDRSPFHTLRPKLPQAVGGRIPCSVHLPFEEIFEGKNIRFVQSGIEGIDTDRLTVTLEDGELHPDYMVVAIGGESKPPKEGFLPAWSFEQACNIRRRIGFLAQAAAQGKPVDPSVAVVGAGFVGVELVAEIQHRLERIGATQHGAQTTLIELESRILPRLGRTAAALARRRLERLGVRIVTGETVLETEKQGLILASGQRIQAGTLIWAGGVRPALPAPLTVIADRSGRIPLQPTLRSAEHANIFAAGDCAYVPQSEGDRYEPSAHRAERQARVVVDNLLATLRGRPLHTYTPHAPKYLLGLGPGYGLLVAPPASPLMGRVAGTIKEGVMMRHLWQIGSFTPTGVSNIVGAACKSGRWDTDPLPEGNALCSSSKL